MLHRVYKHNALKQSCVDVGPTSVTLAHIQRAAKHDTVRNLIYIITTAHQTLNLQQRIWRYNNYDKGSPNSMFI